MAGFEQNENEAEVQERWGDTDAYKESARRTKKYTPEDWAKIKREIEAVEAAMAAVMASGSTPESVEAMDLAEDARLHIDQRYYPCSHKMHAGLADMYTADPRFQAHYDDRATGLAAFMANAIRANTARHNA